MSVNKVILMGNVGRDPELTYPQKGQVLARLSLATNERIPTGNGSETTERTEWHSLVLWGRNAEIVERYVKKGQQLYVEGKLRNRMWEDRNSIKHYVTEVYVDYMELIGRNAGG